MAHTTKPEVHFGEQKMSSSDLEGKKVGGHNPTGTVQLILNNETVLIPTPSPDPKDPLNLPQWRKWAITILLSLYGATAVILASGMGAIITVVRMDYPGEEARTNDLLTYPTLLMAIGNLIAMPLAVTIGRRPIFIITMIALVASGIGCAYAPNLSAHIAFRDIMSLAAGQSEALCPMVIQEIHFLHERGRKIAWFAFIETIVTGAFFMATTPLVSAGGWRWWYGTFTIINAIVLVLSYVFVTETMFDRPDDATEGAVHLNFNENNEVDEMGERHEVIRVTTKHSHVLEPERFGPRTWKQDLKIFSIKPNWSNLTSFYMDLLRGLAIPTIFWLLMVNGAFLGLYILVTSTFASVLIPPPYSFSFTNLGYIFGGEIVVCIVFLPLLGYGNDLIITAMSKAHNGIYKPEYRFINLAIPTIVCVVCGILYGQAAQFPEKYSWGAIAVTFNGVFFAFMGANVVGITYAVDAFPLKAGPLLVVICAGRGFISFGLSYSVLPAVTALGYNGTMNVETIIAGVLGLMGIPMYFAGPKIRQFADRYLRVGRLE